MDAVSYNYKSIQTDKGVISEISNKFGKPDKQFKRLGDWFVNLSDKRGARATYRGWDDNKHIVTIYGEMGEAFAAETSQELTRRFKPTKSDL